MRKHQVWRLPGSEPEHIETIDLLSRELDISRVLASLLVNRNIQKPEEARWFLEAGLECLSEPFLIPGMKEAVDRICRAVEDADKICIYGDYDADGICSVAMMKQCLDNLVPGVEYYIPHRFQEGYGLNCEAIKTIAASGCQLVITVDCGIGSVEEVDLANRLGINVIVTDHHEPSEVLPNACALVNPKLVGEDPINELAGAGVVYQIVRALATKYPAIHPEDWLDIAAIATVADIVPLLGDNRILVKEGLLRLRNLERPGIKALIKAAGLSDRELGVTQIGFGLAPRLNAAGRMGEVQTAVDLLLAADERAAEDIAVELNRLNRRRQEIEAEIYSEACLEADKYLTKDNRVLILGKEDWHQGVIGIVASKMADLYGLPTILIAWEGELGRGSGRSIPGFDLFQAMSLSKVHLERFGGHQQAAGITINRSQFESFSRTMNEVAAAMFQDSAPGSELTLDCEVMPQEITMSLVREIKRLEPFGVGNPRPHLIMRGVRIASPTTVGKKQEHLRFQAVDSRTKLDAIAFGMGDLCRMVNDHKCYDLAFEPDINSFRGNENLQLVVRDLKPSHESDNGSFSAGQNNFLVKETLAGMELSIKKEHETGNPVIVIYPSVRCLEKHFPGLSSYLPEGSVKTIHGRMPQLIRTSHLESLKQEKCQIFLTTETFFQYYIYNLEFSKHFHKFVLWPGRTFSATMRPDAHTFICFDSMQPPQFSRAVKSAGTNCRKLIYTNRKKTLQDTSRRLGGVVEAGVSSIADRTRIREQYLSREETCLLWDGVFGGGLPLVAADQVWFKDAPFGLYEVKNSMAQIEGANPKIDMCFDDDSLEFNRAYLDSLYPDQDAVLSLYSSLQKQSERFRVSSASVKGGHNGGGTLRELKFRSGLHILNDLGLCDYTFSDGWYEISVSEPGRGGIDMEQSPFFLEGLAEKKLFDEFVQILKNL